MTTKRVEAKVVKSVPNIDEISSVDEFVKAREECHMQLIIRAAIAQNKWLCNLMTMHSDYNINHYKLKPQNDYDSATGRVDMRLDYDYVPIKPYEQLSKIEKLNVDKTKHLVSMMCFYDDYDMEHYHIEDQTEENGEPYNYKIYYSLAKGAKNECAISN